MKTELKGWLADNTVTTGGQQRRQNPGIGKRRKPDTIRCTG